MSIKSRTSAAASRSQGTRRPLRSQVKRRQKRHRKLLAERLEDRQLLAHGDLDMPVSNLGVQYRSVVLDPELLRSSAADVAPQTIYVADLAAGTWICFLLSGFLIGFPGIRILSKRSSSESSGPISCRSCSTDLRNPSGFQSRNSFVLGEAIILSMRFWSRGTTGFP